MMASLRSGKDSLPDPDCWVLRAGAEPARRLGSRLHEWAASDVLLVVEVSDTTVRADLSRKAQLYGAAGFGVYWVVSPDVVYVLTGPTPEGYERRDEYRAGDRIPVAYAGSTIAVDDLLSG